MGAKRNDEGGRVDRASKQPSDHLPPPTRTNFASSWSFHVTETRPSVGARQAHLLRAFALRNANKLDFAANTSRWWDRAIQAKATISPNSNQEHGVGVDRGRRNRKMTIVTWPIAGSERNSRRTSRSQGPRDPQDALSEQPGREISHVTQD